jgi:membrane fusion protein (multidrug efflux system)
MKTQDKPEVDRTQEGSEAASTGKKKKPVLFAVVAVVAVLAIIEGVRYYGYASTHTGTDDAYVTSDVIQIAPQVSGTVIKVFVKENDRVKAGQVLAKIDPSTFQQAVDQAQANLDLAIAQQHAAETGTTLTQAQGNAQIESARGVIEQSNAGVSSAVADVSKAAAATASARSSVEGAKANVANAREAVIAAQDQVRRAQAAVQGATAAFATARNNVGTAQANLVSAEAAASRANSDFSRAQVLFNQGAMAAQQLDAYRSAHQQADAQLTAAHQGVASAQEGVSQAQANVDSLKAQLSAAQAAVVQARAQWVAAGAALQSSRAMVNESMQAQVEAEQNVSGAKGKTSQALGQLNQAKTVNQQVTVNQAQVKEAQAKVEQAKAALAQAQLNLGYCTITATRDGQVTHKTVFEGSLVQVGTPLMAEVPDEPMWIIANFKETQLQGVTNGQPAEAEVDSIPGHTFTGKVQSISEATGSTLSLLPADNATGNFTKVVQRVPVKIVLDPGQPALDQLRAGMSSVVNITLKK